MFNAALVIKYLIAYSPLFLLILGTSEESRKPSRRENGRSEIPESSDLTMSQHMLRAKWSFSSTRYTTSSAIW